MQGLTLEVALERLVSILPLLLVAGVGTVILETLVYFLFARVFRSKYALPYTLVAPAVVALLMFTLYPFVYNIRLAFSDLRLKTISCYIPNTDITIEPCSLGQAALHAEVDTRLETDVHLEASEDAPSAFLLEPGTPITITGQSKAVGYVIDTGTAVTETGQVCGTPLTPGYADCVAQAEARELAAETQDERNWWEIQTEDGQTGWIPNNVFFLSGDAQVYAEANAGGDVLGDVVEGQQVRLIERDGTEWFNIRTTNGVEGWVMEQPRSNQYYTAAGELTLYADPNGELTEITIPAGTEVRLLRQEPMVWYQISTDETTAWVSAALNEVEFYVSGDGTQVYTDPDPTARMTLPDETNLQLEENQAVEILVSQEEPWYQVSLLDGTLGWINIQPVSSEAFNMPENATIYAASDGAESLGEANSGDQVVSLGSTNVEGEVWYQITTADGITGWVKVEPAEFTEVINLPQSTFLYGEPGGGDLVLLEPDASEALAEPVPAGTPVQEMDSTTVMWYQVQIGEGLQGWVSAPANELRTAYFAPAEIPAYAEFGSTENVMMTLPEGAEITVTDTREQIWYQVNTDDGAAWTNAEPGSVRTSVTVPPDTQIYAEPTLLAETLGEVGNAEVEQLGDKTTYWYRIRTYDEAPIYGWVGIVPREEVTTEREIVLYSLDYGWENFKRVFVDVDPATGEIRGWGRLLQTENSTFPRLMRTTIAWTTLNVLFHLVFGMMLALMLNKEGLRFKGIYRAIIILPWAIPQVIIALTWKGEFDFQFGFVNTMLADIGVDPIPWLRETAPAFVAVVFVNIWLGIPFYMVTLLGGLQSISGDYYEAAAIDGASAFERFRNITVPLIRPVAVPIVTLDVIWTFNNFNVIYLITEGRPNESTNILVTALYNAAFGRNGQFQLGFAAAFSLVIFAVLFIFAVVWVTQSGALKSVYDK